MKKLISIVFLLFLLGCVKKEDAENYYQKRFRAQHRSYALNVDYFYDESVDICYGVATSHYKLGLVVVPYEKVEHRATIINSNK